MAWRTYTPDGRTLEIEYANGTWQAFCDGGRGEGETAAEAIERSLDEKATAIGQTRRTLQDWVVQQAALLELERDAS